MSDEAKFEATPGEVDFIKKLRAATEPLNAAEIGLLKKRRERGEAGGEADEGEPVTLESIKPGMKPERLSQVLKHIRALAT